MGYMRHHAIIVSGWDEEKLIPIHKKAIEIAKEIDKQEGNILSGRFTELISPIIKSVANQYCSFFVAPDGSKEGWSMSDAGDDLRAAILATLPGREAGIRWVEVQFGDDEGETKITGKDDRPWGETEDMTP